MNLFKSPSPPPIQMPKPMPTIDDAAIKQAQLNTIAAASARSGRSSTILTDTADKLGG